MIYVYSPDLSERHEISHAESLQMSVFYNGIGKFSLSLPIDDYNLSVVQIDSILYDTAWDTAFIIKARKIETDSNRITANGYTTNWILNRRVAAVKTVIGTIETGVYSAINNNLRGLNITTDSVKGLTSQSDAILYGGQLLDGIIEILGTASMGHRMKWIPASKSHVFEVYKGEDKTVGIHAMVFSPERGTASKLVVNDDDSLSANVIYVPGVTTADTQTYRAVGTATGADRTEYWLPQDLRQDSDETAAQFNTRLGAVGQEAAAQLVRRKSFNVEIDPSDYGTVFGLGDIVSCVSTRFGERFSARVTGAKYKMDKNETAVSLTLGEPLINALGEMKLRGY